MVPSSESRKAHGKLRPSRTATLRILLICCLLAAVVICFSISYVFLRNSEHQTGLQTYESVALMALSGAQAITQRRFQGTVVTSTIMGQVQPKREDWPFINFTGFMPIVADVNNLSESMTHGIMVVLEPSQLEAFEDHAHRLYQAEGRPETAGMSNFGFGVWKPDPNSPYDDSRAHDTSGETNWGAKRRILTPLLLHASPAMTSLLFNIYSQKERGPQIDSMIDCVDMHRDTNGSGSPHCSAVTDFLEIVHRPGPAANLFHPIFPAHDPTHFVGFSTTALHWEEILHRVVPNFVNGLTCVIQASKNASYTYEIQYGQPVLIGEGDRHDPKHTFRGKSSVLTTFPTGTFSSVNYTLTVYPTDELINSFTTKSPLYVAFGFLAVILAVAFVFLTYDHFMRHAAHHRKSILNMKRRFVRFISHEIRTPLNTVCTGIELLEREMRAALQNHADLPFHDNNEERESEVPFWHEVTVDLKENAAVAVSILNDLLNYDKIESNTMSLELGPVRMHELLEKTVNQFRIQAINSKLDLQLICQSESNKDIESGVVGSTKYAGFDVAVYGDYLKLGQVLRNLISNSLKFTPPNGSIHIMMRNDPVGSVKTDKDLVKNTTNFTLTRYGSTVIVIQDTGSGLTKEQVQMLFMEGVQFDANRLQHGGGSGLGLSIAHGIIRQHGGALRATSEGLNKGCTFTIELPLYRFGASRDRGRNLRPSETVTITDVASIQSCSENATPCMSRRLLVVEDSESSRKMLIRLLERSGHQCLEASNGEEAVDAVRLDMTMLKNNPEHIHIDTILMDFEMPILKGPAAARAIRCLGYRGRILGVTGNVLSEDVTTFKEHGADDVLAKPVSMSRIQTFWDKK